MSRPPSAAVRFAISIILYAFGSERWSRMLLFATNTVLFNMPYTTVLTMDISAQHQWWENRSITTVPVDRSVIAEVYDSDAVLSIPERDITAYLPFVIILSFWLSFILTWASTTLKWMMTEYKFTGTTNKPRLIPYWFPWVGHTVDFYFNKVKLAAKVRNLGQNNAPLRLHFFNYQANIVSGFDHINAVWRSKVLDTKPAAMLSLTSLFNYPAAAYNLWAADDSGTSPKPHPHSNVQPHDRMYFHTHRTTHAFMNGSTLKHFANRFQSLLQKYLSHSRIESEWTSMPDFYSFVQTKLSTAAVEAMCGPTLLALNPNIMNDFWEFDGALPKFFGGIPQLTAPSAYKARSRVLEGLKKWHSYAKANFDESSIEADGHDPFWGTSFMRSRQQMWSQMKPMDADACASEDLGIIWGENSNSIPAAFWCVSHIYRDPTLLARVRTECAKYQMDNAAGPDFDAARLCKNPLLQSIWSEALRLYVALFIIRGSDHDNFQLDNKYTIEKQQMIAVDTYTAHHDTRIWSEGNSIEHHPINTFWADRFLIYPDDPLSGPLRAGAASMPVSPTSPTSPLTPVSPASPVSPMSDRSLLEPRYSTSGLSGAWIPFGGGRHSCPGKQFAKQEIILCMAMMCTMFDVELDPNTNLQPDMDYFGMGSLPHKGEVPFKIRRRQRI